MVAPEADKFALAPAQIVADVAVIVGEVFTVTVVVFSAPTHEPLAPVTEYTVVAAGLTLMFADVAPVFQV